MMLAIEIEFLTGRYVAMRHDDREAYEWPPHPARLFSALVAEWGTPLAPDPGEEAVLRRLEALGAPNISAGPVEPRSTLTHYVPVNDPSVIGSALWKRIDQAEAAHATLASASLTPRERQRAEKALAKAKDVGSLVTAKSKDGTSNPFPDDRGKQARTFPSVTVVPRQDGRPTVTYSWPSAGWDAEALESLDGLLQRVTRLGHSSSLISARVIQDPTETTHWPVPSGDMTLRTVETGQLDALVTEFAQHHGHKPRTLTASYTDYTTQVIEEDVPVADTSGTWFAFSIDPRIPGRTLASLTESLRQLIAEHADPDDAEAAHETYVLGLPHVGFPHARGDLLGCAIVLPRLLEGDRRKRALRAIGTVVSSGIRLAFGDQIRTLTRTEDGPIKTLLRQRWQGTSRTWISATPLVIAGSPTKRLTGEGYSEWLAEWISDSCRRAGLPSPLEVETSPLPLLTGALPARRYPQVVQQGRIRRLVHAAVTFPEPVYGPLLLGGGRHSGFGLMTPMEARDE